MQKLSRAIDRFCYKHPGFGIRNLMLLVVIGNVLVWIAASMDRTGTLASAFYFNPHLVLQGQIWRLVTFPFVPGTSGITMLISLYFYYSIGRALEQQWGSARFTLYYLLGMLLHIIFGFILYLGFRVNMNITAYWLNMSMFFAFAVLYPDARVLLFFIIPIKIKWLALIDAAYFVLALVSYPLPMNLLPLVAVANFFLFCGGDLFAALRHRPVHHSAAAINFKQEAARIRREQAKRPAYTRRCEVCGRTDTDHPELEFRYCSRCQGFHCFCQDHINNHTHFTE